MKVWGLGLIIAAIGLGFLRAILACPPTKPSPPPDKEAPILEAINNLRIKHGALPLYRDVRLDVAAKIHAVDTANRRTCTHTSEYGETVRDRANRCEFPWLGGEEILVCGTTETYALTDLIAPDTNRAILVRVRYKYVGLGYWEGFLVVVLAH
jgi:uncharacterized protein YkwD